MVLQDRQVSYAMAEVRGGCAEVQGGRAAAVVGAVVATGDVLPRGRSQADVRGGGSVWLARRLRLVRWLVRRLGRRRAVPQTRHN